jgi:microcystin degradation protein MlrC
VEAFWQDFGPLALAGDFDAVFLVLHGAMASQSHPSVEHEIFMRLRTALKTMPLVFGALDLHANLSEFTACCFNGLVAYRENPHTDAREAAVRAAKLLQRSLTTGERPRVSLRRPGLIWPPTGTGTASDPMKSLEALARDLERTERDIWDVSILAGFSFADTPHCGVSLAISTTCEDMRRVLNWLNVLEQKACSLKLLGLVTDPPADKVLAQLSPLPHGLTVLVEPSDNIGGGASGDGTGLLRALLRHRIENAAICLADAEAVRALEAGERQICLGGKGSRLDEGPVELDVELLSLNDGRFELEDKNSHLASMCGDAFDMGRCAVVKHAGLTALIVDMHAPGVEVRPLRQMTGEAEFNEVYFTDAKVPFSETLGSTGDGWRVSLTTLMNERVAIGGAIPQQGSGPIREAVRLWNALSPERKDSATKDRLMQLWSRAEVARLTNIRAGQSRKMGVPGPEGSIGKMVSADLNKETYEFCIDLLGADGMLYGSYEFVRPDSAMSFDSIPKAFLRARANSIEGGTSEVMRNILGERVLGLPGDVRVDREMPWSKVPRN